MERCRQRLLGLRAQAVLADRQRLRAANGRRRLGGCRPEHRRCRVRQHCNFVNQLIGQCFKGWGVVGGTSASSPIIASVYALAGNGASVTYGSFPYSHTSALNDVTSGSNGSCGGTYLCTAVAGFDGPTGLGTPNGTGAF
jgi:hypothetical protein